MVKFSTSFQIGSSTKDKLKLIKIKHGIVSMESVLDFLINCYEEKHGKLDLSFIVVKPEVVDEVKTD